MNIVYMCISSYLYLCPDNFNINAIIPFSVFKGASRCKFVLAISCFRSFWGPIVAECTGDQHDPRPLHSCSGPHRQLGCPYTQTKRAIYVLGPSHDPVPQDLRTCTDDVDCSHIDEPTDCPHYCHPQLKLKMIEQVLRPFFRYTIRYTIPTAPFSY